MKEKIKKDEGRLYCEPEDCLCFGKDTEDGSCRHEICLHKQQRWIDEQTRINARKKERGVMT